MSFFQDRIAPRLKQVEAGYSNNPADRGGETNHGITIEVARRYGYAGPMREMPYVRALDIFERRYFIEPGFNRVATLAPDLAVELTDTGVNMGQHWPGVFLQLALTRLNRRGKDYSNLKVDGALGPASIAALDAFLKKRGKEGEKVLLTAVNCMQGSRYFDITPEDDQNEDFLYGWFLQRVAT